MILLAQGGSPSFILSRHWGLPDESWVAPSGAYHPFGRSQGPDLAGNSRHVRRVTAQMDGSSLEETPLGGVESQLGR